MVSNIIPKAFRKDFSKDRIFGKKKKTLIREPDFSVGNSIIIKNGNQLTKSHHKLEQETHHHHKAQPSSRRTKDIKIEHGKKNPLRTCPNHDVRKTRWQEISNMILFSKPQNSTISSMYWNI